MNLFFDSSLTGWDIEFQIGRFPVRYVSVGHKILFAECWHNPDWNFQRFVRSISDRICPEAHGCFWAETAIRCAFLFGISGQLMSEGYISFQEPADISVSGGDLSAVLSALYAREMGLPIGNIICCCNDNGSMWDLLHQGQIRTDGICVRTSTPDANAWVPEGLEQLIYCCAGEVETRRFNLCCREGSTYYPDDSTLLSLRRALHVSVVGEKRMRETISGIFRGSSYVLSPYTALAYSGAQDYRVRTQENGLCLVLAEKGPECDATTIAEALNIPVSDLRSILQDR